MRDVMGRSGFSLASMGWFGRYIVLPVIRILPIAIKIGAMNRRKKSASRANATRIAHTPQRGLISFRSRRGIIAIRTAPMTAISHITGIWDMEVLGSAYITDGAKNTAMGRSLFADDLTACACMLSFIAPSFFSCLFLNPANSDSDIFLILSKSFCAIAPMRPGISGPFKRYFTFFRFNLLS